MRRITIVGLAGAAVTTLSVLAPVAANAGPGDTGVTFTLTGGSLSLSTPSSTATLTSGGNPLNLSLTGGSVSGSLGSTTVTDLRGLTGHADTVNMVTTDFTDGSGDTIAKSNATAYSGTPTATSGVGVTVPTTAALPANIGATGGGTVFQMTGVIGSSSATYNPTVTVNVPANAVAGTYTGTVTQTVS